MAWFLWAIITASLAWDLFWSWMHATLHTSLPAGRTRQETAAEPEQRSLLHARKELTHPAERSVTTLSAAREKGVWVLVAAGPTHPPRRPPSPTAVRGGHPARGPPWAAAVLLTRRGAAVTANSDTVAGSWHLGSKYPRHPKLGEEGLGAQRNKETGPSGRAPENLQGWAQNAQLADHRQHRTAYLLHFILTLLVITWMVFAFRFIFPAK